MVKEIHTEKEFSNIIGGNVAVVDFWAKWCMPCVMLAPVIEKLSKKFKKITFAKVNVDDNRELAEKFQINTIPTLLVFKKGKLIDRIIGALSEEELEKKLKKL